MFICKRLFFFIIQVQQGSRPVFYLYTLHAQIGIFHLPKTSTTDDAWSQNEETGEFTWNKVISDSNEPELLIVDMENDLMTNYYENSASVYLIVLIHSTYNKPVNVLGYMLMREFDGKVSMTKL